MLKYNLKLALRMLLKNRSFSLISIVGLALGIAAFLTIAQFVIAERSYDNFQEYGDRIYRIKQNRYNDGILSSETVGVNPAIGYRLHEAFPEVEEFVRMRATSGIITLGNNHYKEENIQYVSNSFFKIFTMDFKVGNPQTALSEPNTVVLTETVASKYFGEEDALGKSIEFKRGTNSLVLEVAGVVSDLPENSHMLYDILISWSTYSQGADSQYNDMWINDGFLNYILLREGTRVDQLLEKISVLVTSLSTAQLAPYNQKLSFALQPLRDIHLYSAFNGEFKQNGSASTVNFLSIIGVLVILLAWINHVNLVTAMAIRRSKEVGLRKILGSGRLSLIKSFLLESILTNLVALMLAVGIIILFSPWLISILGVSSSLSLSSTGALILLSVFLLLSSSFTGVYPALVLSSFQPSRIIGGQLSTSGRGGIIKKGLVVFQFVCAGAVLMATYTIFQQLNFMKTQELGVDLQQTLIINGPGATDSTFQTRSVAFSDAMEAGAVVESVVSSSHVPGNPITWGALGVRKEGAPTTDGKQFKVTFIGYDYIEAYRLKLIAGRSFSRDFGTDQQAVVFTRAAVEHFGFNTNEEALGTKINLWNRIYTIVGVLENYHQTSLKDDFEEVILRCVPSVNGFFSVKFNVANAEKVKQYAEAQWEKFFPGNPFEYSFLEDQYDRQYQSEDQFGNIFSIFSGLTVFIACLGLFGLAAYMAIRRTKEIGVRKVLGANVMNILRLLSVDFLKLITISIILAVPIAYFGMDRWLSSFVFRIDLQWYIFTLPAIAVLFIALMTVMYQASKAAKANPVNSLRSE